MGREREEKEGETIKKEQGWDVKEEGKGMKKKGGNSGEESRGRCRDGK